MSTCDSRPEETDMRILIAEDETIIRLDLKELLERKKLPGWLLKRLPGWQQTKRSTS